MLIYMWKHVDFKEVRVAGVKLAGPQVEGSISSAEGSEVGRSAIRRIAFRLVPFLMLCYSITYLNRVNLSFASVAMSQSPFRNTFEFDAPSARCETVACAYHADLGHLRGWNVAGRGTHRLLSRQVGARGR